MPSNDDIVHGICGACGGAIVTPRAYMSVLRPVPSCERCGAIATPRHGAKISVLKLNSDARR